jgi:hypothetical protein
MKKISVKTCATSKGQTLLIALGALLLVFGLAGCATPATSSKAISIESDPTGMRVEVNGEYLGRTPTLYAVHPNHKGDFPGGWGDTPSIVFVAFPPEGVAGLYKQTKAFSPSGFMEKGDRVPARILFDMHQKFGY